MPKKNQKGQSSSQSPKDKVLECLKKNCLLRGTSLKESGRSFSIKKKLDQKVQFFQLDKEGNQGPGRKCLGISPSERICDLLVVIAEKKTSAYIFVELKAGEPGNASKQIENTIKSAQQKTECTSRQVFGLIACKGSSPTGDGRRARKNNPDYIIVSRCIQRGISVTELMKIFNL
jgi:hypothetical protein